MSWWDPIVDYFGGDSGASFGDALGQTASNAGTALSGLFSGSDGASQVPGVATSLAGDLGSYYGGTPVNTTSLAGLDAASAYPSYANTTTLSGIDAASKAANAGSGYGGLISGAGMGSSATGLAESGGAGLMDKATDWAKTGVDWAKKNPTLVDRAITAGLALGKNNSPSAATAAGYNAASAANAAKTAVGSSQINQAPFLADNALAASKNAGASASSSLAHRLTSQGYKPGDAMYDSMMQQQQLGNSQNDATAYAAGQGQRAAQEKSGADLMTPNLTGYDTMAKEQNAQQGDNNQKTADLAALGKSAFDIWANPDKATKTPSYT